MILVMHIISVGFVLGVTVIADKEVLAWVCGKKTTLDRERMQMYHALVWIGLIAIIASGIYMFYPMRLFLLTDIKFVMKMFFVGILIANAFLIGRLMHIAFDRPFFALTTNEKMSLLASGAISTFSWISAFALAVWIFE